ncbi:mechanosensitive ion channel domain-containing protein [Methanothrix sp.]|uniref:mechanosensitive ion channel family protein n=1 Tax=Methanothrix sp. TaxID=90426 RepID=UPI002C183720|nr:mechanosensitive ion channel domain-containing protein [Methanothrix sp.]HOK57847.1 mechanosensitive ion channel [Methanothrix sp.]HOL43250.1 mechanosensitive ion channel [Methanothrix sp.]HPO88162.1 mechanosensitive ion channel [Methanothrix sp.]
MVTYTLGNVTVYPAAVVNDTIETITAQSSNSSLTVLYSALSRIDPIALIANLVIIIIILIGTQIAAKIADRMLQRYFLSFADRMLKNNILRAEHVEEERTRTFHIIIRRIVVAAIYLAGIALVILQIPQLYRIAVALLAGAGLAGLAIGFAAKDALSNLISGLFIAVFQPIRVGDYVTFRNDYGYVEDITLRHTVICTWDKRRIVVPNSVISTEVIVNWSMRDPVSVWTVDFLIQDASKIDRAKSIILEIARSQPHVLKELELKVLLVESSKDGDRLRLYFNSPNRDLAFETGCQILEEAKKIFMREGIS